MANREGGIAKLRLQLLAPVSRLEDAIVQVKQLEKKAKNRAGYTSEAAGSESDEQSCL